jgi:hypothetical protein
MSRENKRDARLEQIWGQFCDDLKSAGDLVLRKTTPQNEVTRASGLRLLARNISLALQFELENKDPKHPELMHYFDPVRKQGGDNTDALYVGAPVDGQETYRISGHRGTACYFAVTVLEDGETPWGGGVVGTLFGPDMVVDSEGNFELILSPEAHPGNWIQTTPGTYRVTFRQFFADWNHEKPMDAAIECLTCGSTPPPEFSLEALSEGLTHAAQWLRVSTHYWANKLDAWQARPNSFIIVRVVPPECDYWNCEFGSYWWETMDYRWRLSSTNIHHAALEPDGTLTVVVSHDDPGVVNWLDPSGHEDGYITFRWMGAKENPRPSCNQVSRSELFDHLSIDVPRIGPQEREAQIRARRRGVRRRFKA